MVWSLKVTFKQKFIAGLLVLIPVVVTLTILIWFFTFIDGILGGVYERIFGAHISGLGFITAIILVFLAGVISTNVLGKRIISLIEKGFLHTPVFKGIYITIKQTVDAFSPEKSSFKKFVLVEYPRPGIYSFGFLTKECSLKPAGDSEVRLKAVYIPTNHLYLGEIVLFKEDEVFYPGLTVDEGIKIILSGGIAIPDYLAEAVPLKKVGS